MQDERQPLGRSQGVQYHLQGKANRVGQQRLLFRLQRPIGGDDGIGHVCPDRCLAPNLARAQDVQAHPRGDRGQPSAKILHPFRSRPAHPQPGVLNGVVGPGQRAQHPVGHRTQVAPVLLEAIPATDSHPLLESSRRPPAQAVLRR
jgi:hypothetical protein